MSERRMWPTPTANDDNKSPTAHMAMKARMKGGARHTITSLQVMVKAEAQGFKLAPAVSQPSMFSAADSPASPTVLRALAVLPPTSATSGRSTPVSFASLDPAGSWRKTSQGYGQVTLDGSLEAFSETWPKSGMTRNGTAFLLPTSAPRTSESASGLWPTPISQDAKHSGHAESGPGLAMKLSYAVHRQTWPTPTSRDWRSEECSPEFDAERMAHTRGKTLPTIVRASSPPPTDSGASGSLNPEFVEWLMGYPLGWTVLKAWGTRSSRKSRNGLAGASSKRKDSHEG